MLASDIVVGNEKQGSGSGYDGVMSEEEHVKLYGKNKEVSGNMTREEYYVYYLKNVMYDELPGNVLKKLHDIVVMHGIKECNKQIKEL